MEEYDFVASRADEAFVDALAASTKKAYDGKNDGYLNHSRSIVPFLMFGYFLGSLFNVFT